MLEYAYVRRALLCPGVACDSCCLRERSAVHAKVVAFTSLGRIPVWSFAVVVQLRLYLLRRTNPLRLTRACIGLWLMACACSGPSAQSESEVPATQSESDG